MKRKILFSDLDETLLNQDKTISEENRSAITKLLEQGHYFVVVTGRPVATGRAVIMELGLTLPGCYMVAFNGAVIYDCASDRILMEYTVPIEVTNEIFEEAQKAGIHVQTYHQNLILTKKHNRELDFYIGKTKMEYKLVTDLFTHLEK
ncbi:MAG: HAD-IIB family hydrolase, partial [Lachnospiraceae bacterium]